MPQKIICIDDDPIALLLSKLVISKSKFKSETTTLINGVDALNYLSILNEENINKAKKETLLILLDLNMPVIDGWELLEELSTKKFENIELKIILLTSSIDPADIQKSKSFKMVIDFHPKPLTVEILNSIVVKLKA